MTSVADDFGALQTLPDGGMNDIVVSLKLEDGSTIEIDDAELSRLLARKKMDEAVEKEAYKHTPVGQDIAAYLRALRARDGSPRTYYDYEKLLYQFAIEFAHLELEGLAPPPGVEIIDDWVNRNWGDRAAGTKRKVISILSSFFGWAYARGRISANPGPLLNRPKHRQKDRHAHSPHKVMEIVRAQPTLRDQCGVLLLGKMGLRKNELRLLQIKHLDLEQGLVRLMQKGGDVVYHPLVFPDVVAKLADHLLQDAREAEEYLLYPRWERRLADGTYVFQRDAKERQLSQRGMHEWWVRCLARAEVPHFPMHEMRHTAGTEFHRAVHDLELTRRFMRHKSIATTSGVYMHLDHEDQLVAGMQAAARWDEQDTKSDVKNGRPNATEVAHG